MIDFEESFIQVTQEYLEASAKLAQATALCGDDPIKQDMVILSDSTAAGEFAAFMRSDTVSDILLSSGYLLPEGEP